MGRENVGTELSRQSLRFSTRLRPTRYDPTVEMAAVVFIRGVNVGGHRPFRPAAFAKELSAFDVVNIGAAGTFTHPAALASLSGSHPLPSRERVTGTSRFTSRRGSAR